MARWLLPVLLAACGGGSDHAPDAAADALPAPDVDGFDVVVSSSGVVVWVGFTGAIANGSSFAAPGACAGISDIVQAAPGCFAGVDIDNQMLDSRTGVSTPNNPYELLHPTTATSMLSATDCGRRIEIPLHAGPFPIATNVSAIHDGSDIVVSWNTSAPFAVSTLDFGVGESLCNDAGATQHRFVHMSGFQAGVQPLSAPEITQTELGEVRVWYGDRTDVTIP